MSIRDEIQKSCDLMGASVARRESGVSDYYLSLAILDLYKKIDALTPVNRPPTQFERDLYGGGK